MIARFMWIALVGGTPLLQAAFKVAVHPVTLGLGVGAVLLRFDVVAQRREAVEAGGRDLGAAGAGRDAEFP